MAIGTIEVLRVPLQPGVTSAETLIAHASEWAEKQFAKVGEILPMWIAFNAETQFVIQPAGGGKDAVTSAVRVATVASKCSRASRSAASARRRRALPHPTAAPVTLKVMKRGRSKKSASSG